MKKDVQNVQSLKKLIFEKLVLKYVTTWNDIFEFFCAPSKNKIWSSDCQSAWDFERNLYNVSDFESYARKMSEFEKSFIQKVRVWSMLLRENDFNCIFPAFPTRMIKKLKFFQRISFVSEIEKKFAFEKSRFDLH